MNNEPATYVVSIPDGASWVHVKLNESISVSTGRSLTKEAIELANRYGLKGFLYDGTEVTNTTIGVVDQYQYAHHDLASHGIDKHSKIALCVRAQDSSRDFVETVLRNAGYNCRLFTNETEAVNWLQE